MNTRRFGVFALHLSLLVTATGVAWVATTAPRKPVPVRPPETTATAGPMATPPVARQRPTRRSESPAPVKVQVQQAQSDFVFRVDQRETKPVEPVQVTADRQGDLVELGRRLFFEPTASHSGRQACASCHLPDHAFADRTARSEDAAGPTARSSQTLLETAGGGAFHWDGEFPTIEALVGARTGEVSPDSDGSYATGEQMPSVAPAIEARARYDGAFEAVFGTKEVTTAKIATAIAAYVRTLHAEPAPFDRFARGETDALSDAARRGMELFRGRAGCVQCHTMNGPQPTFTDGQFHNTGLAWTKESSVATPGRGPASFATVRRLSQVEGGMQKDDLKHDAGRMVRTGRRADARRFKTPTLRDVAQRGPYMHDGSFETLEEVVRYYVKGGSDDKERDALVKPFHATDQDVGDLVAFLESLSGERRAGLARAAWSARPARTELRFLDESGRPLVGVPVWLHPAGDVLPGETGDATQRTWITDDRGTIAFAPPTRTHVLVVLPQGVEPTNGGLVPDTCRTTDLVVPRPGWITLDVVYPGLDQQPMRPIDAKARGGRGLARDVPAPFTLEPVGVRYEEGRIVISYGTWFPWSQGWTSLVVADPRGATPGAAPFQVAIVPGKPTRLELP